MPRKITYECKQCGIAKGDNNHWYILDKTKAGYHLYKWWWAVENDRLDDENIEFVCGQACGHQLLDQFFAKPTDPLAEENHETTT